MHDEDILHAVRELEERTEAQVRGLLERAARQAESARREAFEEIQKSTADQSKEAMLQARRARREVWIQAGRQVEEALRARLARTIPDPEEIETLIQQARPRIMAQVAGALAELEQE